MANVNCLEGMQCPKCREDGAFYIRAEITCYVTNEGSTESDQSHHAWDENSYCRCANCDHEGIVDDFKTSRHTPASPEEAKLYEDYFDTMERANAIPLPFASWKLLKGGK